MKIIGTTKPGYYLMEVGEGELSKIQGRSHSPPQSLPIGTEIDVHKIFDKLTALVMSADGVDKFIGSWREFREAVWPPKPTLPAPCVCGDPKCAECWQRMAKTPPALSAKGPCNCGDPNCGGCYPSR